MMLSKITLNICAIIFSAYFLISDLHAKETLKELEIVAQSGKEFMSIYNGYMQMFDRAFEIDEFIAGARSGDIKADFAFKKIEYLIVKVKIELIFLEKRLKNLEIPINISHKFQDLLLKQKKYLTKLDNQVDEYIKDEINYYKSVRNGEKIDDVVIIKKQIAKMVIMLNGATELNDIAFLHIKSDHPEYFFRKAIKYSNDYLVNLLQIMMNTIEGSINDRELQAALNSNDDNIYLLHSLIDKGEKTVEDWMQRIEYDRNASRSFKEKLKEIFSIYSATFDNEKIIVETLEGMGKLVKKMNSPEDLYDAFLVSQAKMEVLVKHRMGFVNHRQSILANISK